jgi:hypothetical protein
MSLVFRNAFDQEFELDRLPRQGLGVEAVEVVGGAGRLPSRPSRGSWSCREPLGAYRIPFTCGSRQCLTCRKKTLPAIFLAHLHSRTTSACFRARGMGLLSAVSEMPYSPISHFLVGGSIRERLISFPCFRQKSSNDLSVTNVSTSLSRPSATSF